MENNKNNDEVLNKMGKILLNEIPKDFRLKSSRFNNYTGAQNISEPIGYEKIIFMDKDKEKEWEDMDPSVKKHVLAHLESTCSMMENKISIQLLCHVINDLEKRIQELEKF